MTAVPAIYGELSASQLAAYQGWTDATVQKAEHVLDCPNGCDILMMRCPAGMLVAEEERAAYRRWYDARTVEVTS